MKIKKNIKYSLESFPCFCAVIQYFFSCKIRLSSDIGNPVYKAETKQILTQLFISYDIDQLKSTLNGLGIQVVKLYKSLLWTVNITLNKKFSTIVFLYYLKGYMINFESEL